MESTTIVKLGVVLADALLNITLYITNNVLIIIVGSFSMPITEAC